MVLVYIFGVEERQSNAGGGAGGADADAGAGVGAGVAAAEATSLRPSSVLVKSNAASASRPCLACPHDT